MDETEHPRTWKVFLAGTFMAAALMNVLWYAVPNLPAPSDWIGWVTQNATMLQLTLSVLAGAGSVAYAKRH